MTAIPWRHDPARVALLAIYSEADALLSHFTCPSSSDCCHFGRTGREPYLTPVEQAEIRWTVEAQGKWRGGRKYTRDALRRLARDLAELSSRWNPFDATTRTMTRVIENWS